MNNDLNIELMSYRSVWHQHQKTFNILTPFILLLLLLLKKYLFGMRVSKGLKNVSFLINYFCKFKDHEAGLLKMFHIYDAYSDYFLLWLCSLQFKSP